MSNWNFKNRVTLLDTTDSTTQATGSLTVSGGGGFGKRLTVGGVMSVNFSGQGSTPTQRISPNSLNAEASTGWYAGTGETGALTVGGRNVAGTNVFGLYSTDASGLMLYIDSSFNTRIKYNSTIGGTLLVNDEQKSSIAPMIKVSPSTLDSETSIGFYKGLSGTNDAFVIGRGVGGSGSGFGVWNTVTSSLPLQIDVNSVCTFQKTPVYQTVTTVFNIVVPSFTASATSMTALGMNPSDSSYGANGVTSITLPHGLWSIQGWCQGDANSLVSSPNLVNVCVFMNGVQYSETLHSMCFSAGTGTHHISTIVSSVSGADSFALDYQRLGGSNITNVTIQLRLQRILSFT